ncbi:MAG: dephospho-CoA kinase [Chloroflexi bacterium]|nr:dephospho-CoA kinase [Chloroflexota bacterium]MCH8340799.1 dephospho-CoA kinase [Chloroflexota bacterium]MCH8876903.1 dephospho-CoA kinase [Chloroflexota bacterium]
MSRWPGKYVIGLTGNIATGKSVVRKMLEHLGGYGIDADALAHRAMAKGAPGFPLVLKSFGEWIVDDEGQIDRARLAKIVFSDQGALDKLEKIVHPLVTHAIDLLIRRAKHSVVVIEAIKLLESDLAAGCDAVWVVSAAEELQVSRLMHKRQLSEAASKQRISAQSPQTSKLRAASVVIRNEGSFENTWEQVQAAWAELPKPKEPLLEQPPQARPGELVVRRGRPQDADEIARFITQVTHGKKTMNREDVMAAFGEKAFLLIERDNHTAGIAGWQVENLVTRIDELYFAPNLPLDEAIPALMNQVETASNELQSEASLLFLPPYLAQHASAWRSVGYRPQTVQGLGVRAWQEAAMESMPRGSSLWFKRLKENRVLRPL